MSAKVDSILRKRLSFTFGAGRVPTLVALAFVVLFLIFETAYFWSTTGIEVDRIAFEYDGFSQAIYAAYLAAALYLFFLYILATIASRWRFRLVYLAIFAFALLVEYSYQFALGRFTTYYDLIAAISATGEQKADSISAFVSYIWLVPFLVLVAVCFAVGKRLQKFGWKMLAMLFVVTLAFYLHLSFVNPAFFDGRFTSSSFGMFWTSVSDFAVRNPIQLSPITRETVEAPANANVPNNNVIFIFDESIRADHMSLNGYERPTTTYLDELQRKHQLVNWGTASSASTSSHPSYDAFIAGATPEQIETLSLRQLNSMPTIFQYAKAMNYKTTLIDGQMMKYWGGAPDDLNYIDEFDSLAVIDNPDRKEDYQTASNKITDEALRTNGLKQWEIDTKIAERVNKIFTSSTGNFIFIYKRGCHFPYEKNYPENEEHWKPVYHFHEQYEIPPADKVGAIINSYDNSLSYNLDDFFKTLSKDYSDLPNNTIIVYTGDHGESFFANGKAGHGGETKGEAAVPLFILGMKDRTVDTGFKASHANMFTTLLDLMNYPEELRKYPYAISLFKAKAADSRPRYFNPSLEKRVPFD